LALFAAAALLCQSPGRAAEAGLRRFDVPAGLADQTLKTFSDQAGVAVVFGTDSAGRTKTNAVKGNYTTAEAMALLLRDSGLVAVASEKTGTFTITRDPNAPRAVPATSARRPNRSVSDEETIVLSPFTVSATEDRGYQAQSSLAGSRLRTSLKDIAAPTSAFTQQFIEDLAVTSLDELASYMLSTEPENLENLGSSVGGPITNLQQPLRMRGLSTGTPLVNFFKSGWKIDTYNTERFDQSRGPNSVLFGIGNPGGSINVSTKRAQLNANSGSLGLMLQS